jgi:hypothetical protein
VPPSEVALEFVHAADLNGLIFASALPAGKIDDLIYRRVDT